MLLNLVNNALKFTQRGEIVVDVEMADQRLLRLSVRDTGIGIRQEQMPLLFHDFSQVDASTTRKFGGTGLGLAICKRLAELMGGQIGVRSAPGEGSTFWFTVVVEPAATTTRAGAAPRAQLQGLHALVVDGNATNREILFEELGSWGLIVQTTEGPAKAAEALSIATADKSPFDMLIIDMHLPEMTGLEFARVVRQGTWPQPAIFILSSIDLQTERSQLQELGIAACLMKPVRQSKLREAVMGLLATHPTQAGRETDSPAVAQPTTPSTPVEPGQAAIGTAFDGKALKVLLAEDNEINQEVAREFLRNMGAECRVVNNGKLALAALESDRFDLVLMDCQMPEMDGYEATRQIRQQEAQGRCFSLRGRRLPIVALTAHAIKGDRERCLAAGMDNCVTKPIDPGLLEAAIKKQFELRGSRPSPQATAAASGTISDPAPAECAAVTAGGPCRGAFLRLRRTDARRAAGPGAHQHRGSPDPLPQQARLGPVAGGQTPAAPAQRPGGDSPGRCPQRRRHVGAAGPWTQGGGGQHVGRDVVEPRLPPRTDGCGGRFQLAPGRWLRKWRRRRGRCSNPLLPSRLT